MKLEIALKAALAGYPVSHNLTVSNEKVENVVKDPQTPVPSNKIKVVFRPRNVIKPSVKLPNTLTVIVPAGYPSISIFCVI